MLLRPLHHLHCLQNTKGMEKNHIMRILSLCIVNVRSYINSDGFLTIFTFGIRTFYTYFHCDRCAASSDLTKN